MEKAEKEAERTTLAQIKQDKEKRKQLYNDLKKEFGWMNESEVKKYEKVWMGKKI